MKECEHFTEIKPSSPIKYGKATNNCNNDKLQNTSDNNNQTQEQPSRFRQRFWQLFAMTSSKDQGHIQEAADRNIKKDAENRKVIVNPTSGTYDEDDDEPFHDTEDSLQCLMGYDGSVQQHNIPISRQILRESDLENFNIQLQSSKLNTGNSYPLLFCWKYHVYTKSEKQYALKSIRISSKQQLEELISIFKNGFPNNQIDDKIFILIKDGYKMKNTNSKVFAFQVSEGDEYLIFKSMVRLICDDNIGYSSLHKRDFLDIFAVSFGFQATYCVLKLYFHNSKLEMVESFIKHVLRSRLPKNCRYICESAKKL
ncbi:hypothetical protein DASC09_017760 [Saccharomycopsis crataegensis]|uniref:Uncharacterized protein n=1 Tax=Saccharomycopsis crataegensis TaxID=43959 RepID=A0AAV5QIE8_9ASCO|nr:hypothetical protein DASC09_017760 [Saccharomycopsis crataegensis]